MASEGIERLRTKEMRGSFYVHRNPDGPEAAAEIARLRAEVGKMREALEMAEESLDQLLDDMGEEGQCVCLAAKEEAQVALSATRAALRNDGSGGGVG